MKRTCQTCERPVTVRKDGTFREHVNPNVRSQMYPWRRVHARCPGSGADADLFGELS